MKYSRAVILPLILLTFTSCMVASAHPGRTDAQGGHYDRSTGEYHFHHGYPAHQHENGECPYDFDNRTGENSGSSSGTKSSSSRETVPYTEPTTGMETTRPRADAESASVSEFVPFSKINTPSPEPSNGKKIKGLVIAIVIITAIAAFAVYLFIADKKEKARRRNAMATVLHNHLVQEHDFLLKIGKTDEADLPAFKPILHNECLLLISAAQNSKNRPRTKLYKDEQERKKVWEALRRDVVNTLHVPSDVKLDKDLCVVSEGPLSNPLPYGRYTAYVTKLYGNTKLHSLRYCKGADIPVFRLQYLSRGACWYCRNGFAETDDDWYYLLKDFRAITDRYKDDILYRLYRYYI